MGRSSSRNHHKIPRSQTLPSSPTHSSSSSDFEFTVSISPRKSTTNLIPADQLFYKGQLLPLHLSPRLSMVRTLLLASSSTSSSSDTTTTASRHSTASSSSDFPDSRDSSRRPSSVTDDDTSNSQTLTRLLNTSTSTTTTNKKAKYFSLSRFSSVFRKEPKLATLTTTNITTYDNITNTAVQGSVKRVSSTAKDVIRKYLKKVKPLYDKLSQKQGASTKPTTQSGSAAENTNSRLKHKSSNTISHSFSGNLRYPRRTSCVASCPSSMRNSPNHSGVLSRTAVTVMSKQWGGGSGSGASTSYSSETSSMEELHSAIQGAIAHCKNSMNISTNNNHSCSTSASTSTTLANGC